MQHVHESIHTSKDIGALTECPKHVCQMEWIASHSTACPLTVVFDFYNLLKSIIAIIDDCQCSKMHIGGSEEALWPPRGLPADQCTISSASSHRLATEPAKRASMAAMAWIDMGMSWIDHLLQDGARFPTKSAVPFPCDFIQATARPCCHIMHSIFAHIYAVHYDRVISNALAAHVNCVFVHYCRFACRYALLDEGEMAMRLYIKAITF